MSNYSVELHVTENHGDRYAAVVYAQAIKSGESFESVAERLLKPNAHDAFIVIRRIQEPTA